MSGCPLHLAFIGPGGPEFLVVMLILLMLFGAKDAPRILRRLTDIINQFRDTANSFKREVMYGDLYAHSASSGDAVKPHTENAEKMEDPEESGEGDESGMPEAEDAGCDVDPENEPEEPGDKGRDDQKG